MICRKTVFTVLTVLIVLSTQALSDQTLSQSRKAIAMQSARELQAAIYPTLYEGVQLQSAGAIYYPDTIFTYDLPLNSAHMDGVIKEWSESSHRFIVVPFTIGIQPQPGRTPKMVNVTLALSDIGLPARQSIIHDIFPATRFINSPLSASVALDISSKGKFKLASNLSSGLNAEAGLTYKYNSVYANVVSGKASGNAFWQFSQTQDSFPAGDIPMKIILAVPNTYNDNAILVKFDVSVEFTKIFVLSDTVVATFEAQLQLPRN